MKVLLINNQFKIGGAARVAAVMCNEFHDRGVDIRIITDSLCTPVLYELNPAIRLYPSITLKKRKYQKLMKFIHIVKNIRNYIKDSKPDVIIAIQADMYLRTLIATIGLKVPIIVADHTTVTRKFDPVTNYTRSHLYKYAAGLSILTEKDKKLLGDKFPRKEVIYNPLSFDIFEGVFERRKNILCAGRLDAWRVKGIDIIIDIWSEIAASYPDWMLELAGDGDESSISLINQMIENKGLTGRVKLLGLVNNMQELYKNTSIFALPSRVEGFPMVLMEAMSQGCASVAFRIQGSTDEMVEDGAGFVVDDGDKDTFKKQLTALIENDSIREQMHTKAVDSVRRFSKDVFITHWLDYINKTIN